MPNQLHHVVMLSHSATRFIEFLTVVAGMEVQHSFPVPGQVLETTLGWPPSEGADVTILGSGVAGLVGSLPVPQHVRAVAPQGAARTVLPHRRLRRYAGQSAPIHWRCNCFRHGGARR